MIELIAYEVLACEDAEEIIKKIQRRVMGDEVRIEMVEVIKDNSQPGCFVDKTS